MNSTVIVVDDDRDHVSLLSEIIETLGKKVEGIGFDGKDAVELFDKYQPDYVFLDLMMPKFDGFYAIEEIRKKSTKPKIVVVTGDMTIESKKRLDLLDVSVIFKPYEITAIEKIL